MSIGNLKVLSLRSRTKGLADHAGLSQPLELWRVLSLLLIEETNLIFLNKIWWTAQSHTETWAATEDGWTVPSNTLKIMESPLKMTTPTLLLIDPANIRKENKV